MKHAVVAAIMTSDDFGNSNVAAIGIGGRHQEKLDIMSSRRQDCFLPMKAVHRSQYGRQSSARFITLSYMLLKLESFDKSTYTSGDLDFQVLMLAVLVLHCFHLPS